MREDKGCHADSTHCTYRQGHAVGSRDTDASLNYSSSAEINSQPFGAIIYPFPSLLTSAPYYGSEGFILKRFI